MFTAAKKNKNKKVGVNSKADSVSIRRPDFQVPFFQGVTLVFFRILAL